MGHDPTETMQAAKRKQKNNMTTERINLLEEIDFKWSLISTVIIATEILYYLFIKIFNYKCKTVIIPPALYLLFFFPFYEHKLLYQFRN